MAGYYDNYKHIINYDVINKRIVYALQASDLCLAICSDPRPTRNNGHYGKEMKHESNVYT